MIDWDRIVNKYGPMVWHTAYRLLGDHTACVESFQETFICALEISKIRRIRNFPALLTRLVTVKAIDQLRRGLREAMASRGVVDVTTLPGAEPGPARQIQEQELAAELRAAIARLAAKEAEVFCLRYLNDMSYRQIARELDINAGTVSVLLRRARTKLRNFVEMSVKKKSGGGL